MNQLSQFCGKYDPADIQYFWHHPRSALIKSAEQTAQHASNKAARKTVGTVMTWLDRGHLSHYD